jgi:hypothetical protein
MESGMKLFYRGITSNASGGTEFCFHFVPDLPHIRPALKPRFE